MVFLGGDRVMRPIITPADLPQYVPGEIWLDAVDGRWSELSIRGYTPKRMATTPRNTNTHQFRAICANTNMSLPLM
jgi:hypothetical protein